MFKVMRNSDEKTMGVFDSKRRASDFRSTLVPGGDDECLFSIKPLTLKELAELVPAKEDEA